MIGVLNAACVALMTSIGHQVGLFDVLADLPPGTSQEIAEASGLQERYVREWLAAMTTGRIVRHDPRTGVYWLPAEHAASLTRAAGPHNLAHVMQFVSLLASVEEPVVECFTYGGGVPYSAYPRFHRLMAEDSANVHDAALIEGILPLIPGVIDRLREGIDVADFGCGQGHAVNLMAQAFPMSRFTGYDFSAEAVTAGREEANRLGLRNAAFEMRDVGDLDRRDAYELITAFDAIHDQAQPARVLAGIAAALRSDGVFLMVDIKASSHLHENLDLPLATFLYTASAMHCMTVSLALGGTGLGTAWGEQLAVTMLGDAGFSRVDLKTIETDPFNTYYVATKG
ncbi:MAG: class I SAM-dependent methyltransferase [Actinomycetota bacterium]|nr:class I SAM-dependent methyltransferase [Actinomycetota bacterium]